MPESRIVIFGTRQFAEIAHYYFTTDSPYTVEAFTVDGAYLESETFKGLPCVPFEELHQQFPPSEYSLFVAVGIQEVNQQRARKVDEAEAKGYRLASFLSSRASVHPDFLIQPNVMIMEDTTLQPWVTVGKNTIIWPRTVAGFSTHIGSHCWITGGTFGESCQIGDATFIGLRATICPFVSIGRNNIIGAGTLIQRNTLDNQVYKAPEPRLAKFPSQRLPHL